MLERGAFELIDLPDRTQILLNHSLVGIIEEVS